MNKRNLTIMAFCWLALFVSVAALRFVQVDDTQDMPWTTIANSTNYASATQGITADAALPASSTNALVVTALQITGAITTNSMTGVWGVTNATTGQGSVNVLPKISAENIAATVYIADFQQITFGTLVSQVGGSWNGSNWTPNAAGWYMMGVQGRMKNPCGYSVQFRKNNVVAAGVRNSGSDGSRWSFPAAIYNNSATNVFSVWFAPDIINTNESTEINSFNGVALP